MNGYAGEMVYLGLDCSSPYLALALYENEVMASWCQNVGRDHARRITEALDDLFRTADLAPKDLGGVTVGVGPGSYTGLRVGVAVAKGIARSLDIPLRGESSLKALAATALNAHTPRGVVALDARRGNVYAGTFSFADGWLEQDGDIVKTSREGLLHGPLPYFENLEPDAGYLARCGRLGPNEVTPLYL